MKLTDRFDDTLIYKGFTLELDLAFDTVLRAQELNQDDDFNDAEKIDIMCEMFVKNYSDIEQIDIQLKAEIINAIFENFIKGKDTGGNDEPVFDFNQDAEFIYASFLYDYRIDLFEEHGRLHWKKFIALLSSLSDESKFGKVIGIRTAKVPKPTKHNTEERKHLLRMKQIYALKTSQSKEEQIKAIDEKMSAFASRLRKG